MALTPNSDWFSKLLGKFMSMLGKSINQRPRNTGESSGSSGSASSHPAESGNIVGNWVSNLIASLTGNQLTDAQREANLFTHNERIDAQNWTAQREDTELQRRVADAKAAGINPMMVAGSGGVSSSSSGGQSVNPSAANFGIGDLMSMFMMPAQMNLLDAQADSLRAGANEKLAKIPFWKVSADKAMAQIKLYLKQTQTEDRKGEFYLERAFLANVQAGNIQFLQESVKNLYEAQTEVAKSQDDLNFVRAYTEFIHGCYEQKLMDSGYVEALVRRVIAETKEAGARATLLTKEGKKVDAETEAVEIANSLADGTFTEKYMVDKDDVTFFDKLTIQGKRFTSMFGGLINLSVSN